MDEAELAIEDIKRIENSNMYINEKKYYIRLIDTLYNLTYYKNRKSIKEIWKQNGNNSGNE